MTEIWTTTDTVMTVLMFSVPLVMFVFGVRDLQSIMNKYLNGKDGDGPTT